MKLNTHIKVISGFTIAVAIVVVASVVSYRSLKKLTGSIDEVSAENERINMLKRIYDLSDKPDEFVKNYALTGFESNLDSVNKYLALQRIDLEELRQLCFQSLEQLRLVDTLAAYLQAKEDWYFSYAGMKNNNTELEMYNLLSKKLSALISGQPEVKQHIRLKDYQPKKKGLFYRLFGFGEKEERNNEDYNEFVVPAEVNAITQLRIKKLMKDTKSEIGHRHANRQHSELEMLEQLKAIDKKINTTVAAFEGNEVRHTRDRAYRSIQVAEDSITAIAAICICGILTFIFFIIYISVDISKNNKLRVELARSKREALKLLISKGKFLSSVSHEIRTPLNSIIGFSEQLRSATDEEEKERYRESIFKSSQHLLGLVNDILDFSKLEMEKVVLEKIPFSVNDVVMDVVEMLGPSAHHKNLKFTYSVHTAGKKLLGDPYRLKQVLTNLVSNAIKFTEKGKVEIKVNAVPGTGDTMQLTFEVRDTGTGIDEQYLEKIFNGYSQADNTIPRKFGGTGLGLAISKHLVELQGGTIIARSEPGKGSVFTFSLGYQVAPVTAVAETAKAEFDLAELRKYRMLVVDDDDMSALLVSSIMNKHHITHDIAFDGNSAWEKFSAGTYDVVLTDINMPGLNGVEFMKKIRAHPDPVKAGVKVIAMTAHISKSDIASFLKMGFDSCILKPYREESLIENICKVLGLRPGVRQAELQEAGDTEQPQKAYSLKELNRLANNNTDFIIKMIETFIKGSGEMTAQMKESLVKGDWPKIGSLAHKAIPSFAFMGLGYYSDKLRFIENNVANPLERNRIKELIGFLDTNVAGILNDLRNEISRLKQTSLN